mmetsp:Transcript_33651/g.68851  ORF Transcript_33651/g.68851 Transcript_33651/m.68851 type:complete len:210 (-) Transcript_33651:643-1272(-)
MFCVRRWAARSISRKVSFGTTTGGPSSNIFWKRRWVEQSLPFNATAFPCSSPTICTSMCRAPWQSCIMKIGDPGTSFCTWMKLLSKSFSSCTILIPFPPPPSEALIITGNPMLLIASLACSTVLTVPFRKMSSGMVPSGPKLASRPSPLHGMDGTPAVCAKMLAAILSPSTDITGEVGPMKVMPSGFRRSGSLGFSEACPQPGHTASTP